MQPQIQADQWTLTAVAYGIGQSNNAFMVGLAKNMVAVESWGGGYGENLSYNDSNWYHCVCTYHKDSVRIYINSKLIGFGSLKNLDTQIGDLIFGVRVTKDLGFFGGKIDDIGIWNRALDSTEIQNLYNSNTASSKNYPINKRIKLYPNPVKNTLKIEGYAGNSMIQIFDISGQKVLEIPFSKQIDIQELKNGLYFLKLENTQLKFIKE